MVKSSGLRARELSGEFRSACCTLDLALFTPLKLQGGTVSKKKHWRLRRRWHEATRASWVDEVGSMRDRSVTHSLQKVNFRRNLRSHSRSVFLFIQYTRTTMREDLRHGHSMLPCRAAKTVSGLD